MYTNTFMDFYDSAKPCVGSPTGRRLDITGFYSVSAARLSRLNRSTDQIYVKVAGHGHRQIRAQEVDGSRNLISNEGEAIIPL